MIPISYCKINVLHRKYFGHIDILIYYILQIFLNPCQENQCATSFENIIIDEMRLEKINNPKNDKNLLKCNISIR